jgi:hypothetical protein
MARLAGDEAAREHDLREAHRLFTEIGAPIRAAEVAKELDLATTPVRCVVVTPPVRVALAPQTSASVGGQYNGNKRR